MSDRVVLHVGAMKSGTSYLQSLLYGNKAALAEQGVLVPGLAWSHQVRAVRQVLAPSRHPGTPRWRSLVDEVTAAAGPAVISMEYLGPAQPRAAERIVRDLATDVRVVFTVRDLNRSLPSMWQETVQNGRSWTWEHYLDDVRRSRPDGDEGRVDRTSAGGTFWRQQDIARMARVWADVVGAPNVAVVTLPPPGSDANMLTERFAAVAEVELDPSLRVAGSNESLGLASALVLRRLNELLDEQGLRFPAGSGLRKHTLAKGVLAQHRGAEPTLGVEVADWVVAQTEATVAELSALGVRLVGRWSDLDPVPVPGVSPADVPDDRVAEAALAGLAGLLAGQIRG